MATPESEVARITASVPSRSGSSVVIVTSACQSSVRSISSTVPDRLPRDEDLVAGDELAAGLEEEVVLVAVVAPEEQDDHDDECRDQRADSGDASDSRASL